jgi:hypothetical protein
VITKASSWTYKTEGNITSVSPTSGAAGSTVTIRGTDLLSGATSIVSVSMVGVTATIVSQNDTLVVVEAGVIDDSSGGTGDVVLTTVDGSVVTQSNGFGYLTVSDIHSVSPAVGQFNTKVTITGVELQSGGGDLASQPCWRRCIVDCITVVNRGCGCCCG